MKFRFAAAAIALALTAGVAIMSLSGLYSPTAPSNARMRVGEVQSSPEPQADFVWVLVDGAVVQAAYFTGYIPIPGDRVMVTQDGEDWFVVGGKSGFAGNLVVNPHFVGDPVVGAAGVPFNWTHYLASGTGEGFASVTSQGVTTMQIYSISGGDNRAVSAAFPVAPGVPLRVTLNFRTLNVAASTTVELRVAWFGVGSAVYPGGVVAADTIAGTTTIPGGGPPSGFTLYSASVVPPAEARYARFVARFSSASDYQFDMTLATVHA